MFNIDSNWGRAVVTEMSEVLLKKDKPPLDCLLAGMFTHTGTDITFTGGYQKTLFEYTFTAYVNRLCAKYKIKSLGCKIIDVPLKGTNVYEHTLETPDKKQFYCYQYGPYPTGFFDQITMSILEKNTTKGCKHCNYKGFIDDDVECTTCRNGAVRKLIYDNPDCKIFRNHGWDILKEVFSQSDLEILEKFRDHYIRFFTDDFLYKQEFCPLMKEYVDSERFGEYFEADLERDLLMLYIDDELEESDENDEGEDQTQDD